MPLGVSHPLELSWIAKVLLFIESACISLNSFRSFYFLLINANAISAYLIQTNPRFRPLIAGIPEVSL